MGGASGTRGDRETPRTRVTLKKARMSRHVHFSVIFFMFSAEKVDSLEISAHIKGMEPEIFHFSVIFLIFHAERVDSLKISAHIKGSEGLKR